MRRSVALFLVLVAAVAAAWLLRPRQPQTPPPETSSAPGGIPVETSVAAPPRKAAPTPGFASVPLPAEDTPLRDAFAQLDALARAGNAHAACRIAAEIRRCSTVADLIDGAEPLEQTIARMQDSHRGTPAQLQRRLDEAQRIDAELQQVTEHCERWAELPNPRHYLLIAARQGHPESIYRYVGMPLNGSDVLRDPQLALDYRANAFALFRRGLESGDVRMVGLWVRALSDPEQSALSAVLPPDWRSRGMLRELFLLVRTRFGEQSMPAGFSEPERIASSDDERAEARRLFDRYFRDVPPPPEFTPTTRLAGVDSDYFGCRQLAP